jgi:hypothetical protein
MKLRFRGQIHAILNSRYTCVCSIIHSKTKINYAINPDKSYQVVVAALRMRLLKSRGKLREWQEVTV